MTDDVNAALRLRNVEQIYGYSGHDAVQFERVAGAKVRRRAVGCLTVRAQNLFYLQDSEVLLSSIIEATLPKAPREVVLCTHWLAVEGVQPAIPQNPVAAIGDASAPTAAAAATAVASTSVDARPLVKHTLSGELQAYFCKVQAAVQALHTPPTPSAAALAEWTACQRSLQRDGGLQQLLPYLAQFVADETARSLRQLGVLRALLAMCRALLDNATLAIDPYLHQLMPSILTCLLGKRLCNNRAEDHWSLRDAAAQLVADICERFAGYPNLQPRVTKTLLQALLDPAKPLTSHYGCIQGLVALGPHVVDLLLLPHVEAYVHVLQPTLHGDNAPLAAEAQRCYDALLAAARCYVAAGGGRNDDAHQQAAKRRRGAAGTVAPLSYDALYKVFGEALVVAAPIDAAAVAI